MSGREIRKLLIPMSDLTRENAIMAYPEKSTRQLYADALRDYLKTDNPEEKTRIRSKIRRIVRV